MSGQHPGTDGCCTCLCQDGQTAKAVWCWHPHSAREKPLFRHSYTGRRRVLAAQTALAQDEVDRICSKHKICLLWTYQSYQSHFVKFPINARRTIPTGARFSSQNHKLSHEELLNSFPLGDNCDLRSLSYHQFILRTQYRQKVSTGNSAACSGPKLKSCNFGGCKADMKR